MASTRSRLRKINTVARGWGQLILNPQVSSPTKERFVEKSALQWSSVRPRLNE